MFYNWGVKAKTIIDVLCAAHYSYLVEGGWRQRGGIVFVSPPGQLKTTWLSILEDYPTVYLTSDLNLQTLGRLKEDIAAGKIRTLVVPDFQKIYERNPQVSSNVEGALRAMVEEGFVATAYQNAQVISKKARVLFLSACVQSFYENRLEDWKKTGFGRRILFCVYTLKRPEILMDALSSWQRVEIKNGLKFSIPTGNIPYSLTKKEARIIHHWMKRQADVTPIALLQKIGCVLRWRFRRLKLKDETMDILHDFSESLSGEGAEVEL